MKFQRLFWPQNRIELLQLQILVQNLNKNAELNPKMKNSIYYSENAKKEFIK